MTCESINGKTLRYEERMQEFLTATIGIHFNLEFAALDIISQVLPMSAANSPALRALFLLLGFRTLLVGALALRLCDN